MYCTDNNEEDDSMAMAKLYNDNIDKRRAKKLTASIQNSVPNPWKPRSLRAAPQPTNRFNDGRTRTPSSMI
jgi:hypothetical protein